MTTTTGRGRKPSDGATWCKTHDRRECSKNTRRGTGRCHQIALAGLDACKLHSGEKLDKAKARGQANLIVQRFRDISPDDYIDAADALAWAVTVARVDVVDYRITLKDRVAKQETVTSDELDRLMRMESEVARIAKMARDAGVDEARLRLGERTVDVIVAVLRGVVSDLGHNANDPKVAAICRRRLELTTGQSA